MTKWEIIFGIATLISTVIAIWQVTKSKKEDKEKKIYKYLFDVAEKSIEKETAVEELEFLKSEKQRMDEAITKELPKKAHLTVLSDRFRDDEKNVVTYYQRFTETKKEYEQLQGEVNTEIPENILKEIEYQIMPKYLIKEQRDSCMRHITVMAYAASFFSAFNSTKFFTRFLLAATIFPLVRLWRLTFPKDSEKRKEYLMETVMIASVVIGGALSVAALIMLYNSPYYHDEETLMLYLAPGIVLLMLAFMMYCIRELKRHKQNGRTEGEDISDKQEEQPGHKE